MFVLWMKPEDLAFIDIGIAIFFLCSAVIYDGVSLRLILPYDSTRVFRSCTIFELSKSRLEVFVFAKCFCTMFSFAFCLRESNFAIEKRWILEAWSFITNDLMTKYNSCANEIEKERQILTRLKNTLEEWTREIKVMKDHASSIHLFSMAKLLSLRQKANERLFLVIQCRMIFYVSSQNISQNFW
jgi:hypothetical protein